MRVYHLCSASHGINNIALKRIKIARILDLNDPYELLGVDQRDKQLRKAFTGFRNDMNERNGLLCFSENWNNPVLWSHYADKHKGICLGFDVTDGMLIKAVYSNKLVPVKLDKTVKTPRFTEQFMKKLLATKFSHWKYEEEYRLYVKLDKDTMEDGLYFYNFSKYLILREIILGPRCEMAISTVRNLVSHYSHPVYVIKARIAFTKFKIVENRTATRKATA